jgi:hypothetical protein
MKKGKIAIRSITFRVSKKYVRGVGVHEILRRNSIVKINMQMVSIPSKMAPDLL